MPVAPIGFLSLGLFLSASSWSAMDAMPIDIPFYKAHVPYEHLQYSVTNNAMSLDAASRKHFSDRGWVLSQSSQNLATKSCLA